MATKTQTSHHSKNYQQLAQLIDYDLAKTVSRQKKAKWSHVEVVQELQRLEKQIYGDFLELS
ncbi:MAG: hypothetical protein V2I33_11485 [Kangiellaceae bacterium]|jgi:hypothetical protein|nr:hypothetical protein [Kangiellaceae bacterium]